MTPPKDKTAGTTGPLQLADEDRVETYEELSPAGLVVVVRHNLDEGTCEYEWTDRTELTNPPDTGRK